MREAVSLQKRAVRHYHARRWTAGFTLIELLVTLAVVAILLGLAAPSFTSFQRNSELTSTANAFVAALSAARAEAMKRQLNALVVPADGASWTSGWTVFVDVDSSSFDAGNAVAPAGTDIVLFNHERAPASVSVAPATGGVNDFVDGASTYAMFSGSGFMRLQGGTFRTNALDLTNGTATRRIIANPAGRFRVCNPNDTSVDACAPTDAM